MPQAEDIKDIKGLIYFGDAVNPLFFVAIGVIVVLLAGLLYWRFKKPKPARVVPQLSPEAEARLALDSLAGMGLNDYEATKHFHFQLSEIARRYFERRFGIPATDRTVEEMAPLVASCEQIEKSQRENLMKILKSTDRVKFTDENPAPAQSAELLSLARGFVESTTVKAEGA